MADLDGMKQALLSFVSLLAITLAGHAEPGETKDQLAARYGQPLEAAGAQCIYRAAAGYQLVTFKENVSTLEHPFASLWPREQRGASYPHPPFPYQLRPLPDGIGLYTAIFDRSGRVIEFTVDQSTGSSILDGSTDHFVKSGWRGMADGNVTFPVIYRH